MSFVLAFKVIAWFMIYMIPWVIAALRRHPDSMLILWVLILSPVFVYISLAAPVLGWGCAFIYALLPDSRHATA